MSDSFRDELTGKIKWLIFIRCLFGVFLLGSTAILQTYKGLPLISTPVLPLYLISLLIFILSFCCGLLLRLNKKLKTQTYVQIISDTIVVTLVVYVTGGSSSVFLFLYLIVIIYSSNFLPRKAIIATAAICCFQYSIIIALEYLGVKRLFGFQLFPSEFSLTILQAAYKMVVTTAACFSVAFLSDFLARQERKSKKELLALEDHLKRVERVAYVGEMAAGLAHEIRNPLASLSGAIQMLKVDLGHDSDSSRLMQIVLRETDRLGELVNNFLLFARPPEGNREYVDLGEMIVDLVALFENDINREPGIAVEKEIISDSYIEMDSDHLKQVLWNMLLNAAEAIDDFGVVKIEMVAARKSQYVLVQITDSGIGMTNETIKSMFDPFFTTKPHGTGLGLSIVHRILEAYGYRIDVESKINEGSCFTIKFTNALFSKPV
ncbi:MAG: GHKL domain-containing protein [Desulfobulbaceae bacterium]|nr:GHKL domain-containing protein [Desulfobulbaceae bacterium]